MTDLTITLSKEELDLIFSALTFYRLKDFTRGRSSYSVPISRRDRQEWAAFGMKVWDKFYNLSKAEGKE